MTTIETVPSADEYDFGFSFSDEEITAAPTQPTTTTNSEELKALQDKIDSLLDSQEQMLQSAYTEALETKYKGKLKEVENLIMPLLVNLKKNPDKPYINWPNREAVINKQIEKILAVTRSS
jgi:hypothetical protein